MKRSIGFPRMHKEPGEVRDFLPRLIRRLAPLAHKIVIEEGYGSGMGLEETRYTHGLDNVIVGSNQDCYDQDIVVQVRSPEDEEMARMKPGTILFAMLHYPTHPGRVRLMQDLGLVPISMDSVVDEEGTRLIENLRGTSWNAMWSGFRALRKTYEAFEAPDREPLEAVVVGTGPVGRFAGEAATKYGDVALHRDLLARDIPGVVAHLIGRNVTRHEAHLRALLRRADIFVDATFRSDPTQYIFPNALLGDLPAHAVIVDATADPYITDTDPIQVKAIEGIPTGNLDKYEFAPDDPAFDALPEGVDTTHRRTTVSCYSWPGLKPVACMRRYGRQLYPLLRLLLRKPLETFSPESTDPFEAALYRGTLLYYLEEEQRGMTHRTASQSAPFARPLWASGASEGES
ncbi:MAG: alanine dehydrogenase [Anaerolineae bacterium]